MWVLKWIDFRQALLTRNEQEGGVKMKCPNCGNDLVVNAKFCDKCGAPLNQQVNNPNQRFKWTDKYTYIAIATVIALSAIIGFVVKLHKTLDTGVGRDDIVESQKDFEENSYNGDVYQLEEELMKPDGITETEEEVMEESEEGLVLQEESETEKADAMSSDGVEDYILPGSDSRYVSVSELEGLSADELRLARNELYARHGRIFQDENLQNYFNSLDWYEPIIEGEDFQESMLNEFEIANRDLIVAYEEEMGY